MAYIYPAPGVTDKELTLVLTDSTATLTGNITVPALQDVTINAANDVFTWTQLDETAKLQVATTSTNSLAMNLVLDTDTFFGTVASGNYAGATTMSALGIFGASIQKTEVGFELYMGDESDGTAGITISGSGYVTGLAPTVSADAPVWVSPITITVTGEYSVNNEASA